MGLKSPQSGFVQIYCNNRRCNAHVFAGSINPTALTTNLPKPMNLARCFGILLLACTLGPSAFADAPPDNAACGEVKKTVKGPPAKTQCNAREVIVIQANPACPKTDQCAPSAGIELIEKSAKYALDGAAQATKTSAEFAQNTLETVKNFLLWSGGILSFILAIAAWLGWKSFKELKSDLKDDAIGRLKVVESEFLVKAEEKLRAVTAIHEESVVANNQAKSDADAKDRLWKFFSKFSAARNESLFAALEQVGFPASTRKQLMSSAIGSYETLLTQIGDVPPGEISQIVNSQGLRCEPWDSDIADDVIFFKGWLYRDIAYLCKRSDQLLKAVDTAERGVRECPQDWGLRFNLACYQAKAGRLNDAKRSIESCLNSPYKRELAAWVLEEFEAGGDMNASSLETDVQIQALLAKARA